MEKQRHANTNYSVYHTAAMTDYSIYLNNLANNSPTDITLESARQFAEEYGWAEVKHNANNGFVAFGKQYGDKRLIVYYSTGTVLSELVHPKQGATKQFRMHVDNHLMRKLFENPRMHTYLAYYTPWQQTKRLEEQSWNYPCENYTLQYFLTNIDQEILKLSQLKSALIGKTYTGTTSLLLRIPRIVAMILTCLLCWIGALHVLIWLATSEKRVLFLPDATNPHLKYSWLLREGDHSALEDIQNNQLDFSWALKGTYRSRTIGYEPEYLDLPKPDLDFELTHDTTEFFLFADIILSLPKNASCVKQNEKYHQEEDFFLAYFEESRTYRTSIIPIFNEEQTKVIHCEVMLIGQTKHQVAWPTCQRWAAEIEKFQKTSQGNMLGIWITFRKCLEIKMQT